jgi:hypothetical protein
MDAGGGEADWVTAGDVTMSVGNAQGMDLVGHVVNAVVVKHIGKGVLGIPADVYVIQVRLRLFL